MLTWWQASGVYFADLMVRRRDGTILWHHARPLDELYVGWLGYENARGTEVYARPARGHAWPVVFLDDIDDELARRVVRKYAALAVRTSPAGGCHIWLRAGRPLTEPERRKAQRWLAPLAGADPGSTSGEHLGRLAGFRNWKRGGAWVGVLAASIDRPSWDVTSASVVPPRRSVGSQCQRGDRDLSPSGRDWAWTCSQLEGGADPADVRRRLAATSRSRRRDDADRYATRTVARATARVYGR